MELNELTAVSPVDGRYRKTAAKLAPYFSEFGLIKFRVHVEVEYLIELSRIPLPGMEDFPIDAPAKLREAVMKFSEADARKIKDTEKVTNHDVKAVEYFLKDLLDGMGLSAYREFVHFGLTSQDINNTSIPLSLKEGIRKEILQQYQAIVDRLLDMADAWKDIPLLARTHGQPASPTKLGKEILVFAERLQVQLHQLGDIPFSAKFGGATGNFNAHFVAYPQINWVHFANGFVNENLGLNRSQHTTQIEHYDNLAALFHCFQRINTILIDLCRDMWTYISMEYFRQKIKEGEVGSSAMPHKVNPIDFENAEGNLGIANAIFDHLAAKLPVSRLQRDLTDSTVLRNVGVPLAHSLIALNSISRGLDKLLLNKEAIHADLEKNWAVVAEAIQTVLRREGVDKPYEKLKDLTRTNTHIDEAAIMNFINGLQVNEKVKEELRKISPHNYTGVF